MSNDHLVSTEKLAVDLCTAIADSAAELKMMPIFVRPMVSRGFAKSTGHTYSEWTAMAARFRDDVRRAVKGQLAPADVLGKNRVFTGDLARLAEYYRTAPERAGKFMRDPATLAMVRERSSRRLGIVSELISAVQSMLP